VKKRLALILALLCLAAAVANPATVQKYLDAMVRSGGTVDGGKAFGGDVQILAGTHTWNQSVSLSSGQTLSGAESRTRIIWTGGPGTAAIRISSYTDNHYVHRPQIRNLMIDCINGGDAIAIDPSAKWVDRLIVSNVIIKGGGIQLGGENYGCVLSDVEIRVDNGKQALRIDGQANTLRSVRIHGTNHENSPPALEILGSATLEGFCWIEGWFNGPAARFAAWESADGYKHRGNVDSSITWFEVHREQSSAPAVEIDNADFRTLTYGGTADWPLVLKNDAALYVQQPTNPNAVKGTGTLYTNGVKSVVAEQPEK
jgi:hypothetical protein